MTTNDLGRRHAFRLGEIHEIPVVEKLTDAERHEQLAALDFPKNGGPLPRGRAGGVMPGVTEVPRGGPAPRLSWYRACGPCMPRPTCGDTGSRPGLTAGS